jgi:hypothetical protein
VRSDDYGRLYLAGPMTHIRGFNFKVFDAVTAELRNRGLNVVTPSELDDAATRRAALASEDGDPETYYKVADVTRGELLSRDVRIVIDSVDGVVVLPGWRKSKGARLETYTAWLSGKPIFYYPTLRRVPASSLRKAWLEA